jgi:H+/Cl- antiporter ClcA
MRETKFSLGLPLVIAMSVILATSASVGSVLAAGNVTPSGAAGNMTKSKINATSSTSSNMTKIKTTKKKKYAGKK